jgi:hypothetical protein
MFTTRPPARCSSGKAAWRASTTPPALTSMSSRCTAAGISSNGPMRSTPALLTSRSRRPARPPQHASSAAPRDSGSVTSQGYAALASCPSSPARSASPAASRSASPTRQPRAANSRAVARPMPEAAPVMNAVFAMRPPPWERRSLAPGEPRGKRRRTQWLSTGRWVNPSGEPRPRRSRRAVGGLCTYRPSRSESACSARRWQRS